MIVVIILGVLLDLLSWKYRKFARYIIYYEMIYGMLFSFVPVNLGDLSNPFYVLNIGVSFVLYACQVDVDIVSCTIALTIQLMIQKPLVFNQEFTLGFALGQLFHSVFALFFLMFSGMLVTYIAQIRGKLDKLIAENFNLFDRMHEGLIIISQIDQSL